MLSIVIPVFNRLDLTRGCIASLRANPPETPHEIVVVDNGSTDGTREWLAAQNDLLVVTNQQNRGFAVASNQGVAATSGDTIVFCNNDIEVDAGFADVHVDVLAADSSVAAVGSRLLFPGRSHLQHAGVVLYRHDDETAPNPWGAIHRFYRRPADYAPALRPFRYQVLTAALLSVRRDAYQAVGGFDEGFWNGYEDVDLCLKLGAEGGALVYEPRSVAVHHESASGPERFRALNANVERLVTRWRDRVAVDVRMGAAGRSMDPDSPIGAYRAPAGV